jgi:hypothetical protein
MVSPEQQSIIARTAGAVVAVAAVLDEPDLPVQSSGLVLDKPSSTAVRISRRQRRMVRDRASMAGSATGWRGQARIQVGAVAGRQPVEIAECFLERQGAEQDVPVAAKLGDRGALGSARLAGSLRGARRVLDQLSGGVLAVRLIGPDG